MNLKNKSNEYQQALGDIFDKAPKAVLAAIATSALTCGGGELDQARDRALREWWVLYEQGIVPQKPTLPKPADDFAL